MCSAEISIEPIRYQLSREEKSNHMIIVIMAISADSDAKANTCEVIISSAKELGYDCLKPNQLEVVRLASLSQAKMSVCLPTGSGKSLCYALLPLVFATADEFFHSCCQSSYSPDEGPGRQF